MKSFLVMLAMMLIGGLACRTPPPSTSGTGSGSSCSTNHGVPPRLLNLPEAAREAAARSICDTIALDLAQLPPELARAGCTTLNSYQLGVSSASARYALCPAPAPAPAGPSGCECPRPGVPRQHPCPSPVAEFVTCFSAPLTKPDGTVTGQPYGWAHVSTTVCDACVGSSLPDGMVLVVWVDKFNCPVDSRSHDAAIAQKAHIPVPPPPLPPPPPSPGSPSPVPCSGCYGGCMAPSL